MKVLLVGVLVNRLGGFLQIFLILFLTARGIPAAKAGIALTAYGAGAVTGVIAGGILADWIGPRLTIAGSVAGGGALTLSVYYVPNYALLVVLVALTGTISQLYRPAAAALIGKTTGQSRQVMTFALYRLALNIGTAAAPLIGSALITISYGLLFWGDAVTSFLYAIIALAALSGESTAPRATGSGRGQPGEKGYLKLATDLPYVAFLIAVLLNAAIYVQYTSTLPIAMKSESLPIFWYGAIVSINAVFVIAFELPFTKYTQRLSARVVLTTGFPLMGAGFAIYAVPGGLGIIIAGTLLWSLAEIILGPTVTAYPVKASPPHLRSRYIGAMQGMYGIGTALGPALGVALWTRTGRLTWIVCGTASFVCLLAGWYGTPARRAGSGPEPEPRIKAGSEPDRNRE